MEAAARAVSLDVPRSLRNTNQRHSAGLSRVLLLTVVILTRLAMPAISLAQDDEESVELPFPELYPPELAMRLMQSDEDRQKEVASVLGDLQWPKGSTLRICFLGGSQDLRSNIVEVALGWTDGTGIDLWFDFGSFDNPRRCQAGIESHIRIGFDDRTHWSLIGNQTEDSSLVAANGKTMNLARFDSAPPSAPEFDRIVLHEFGHALGLIHQHQNPRSSCEADLYWPRLYRVLEGSPYYYNREWIDYNYRRILEAMALSDPDAQSVMAYEFPTAFLKSGTSSPCWVDPSYELSGLDSAGVIEVYGRRPSSEGASD